MSSKINESKNSIKRTINKGGGSVRRKETVTKKQRMNVMKLRNGEAKTALALNI